MLDKQIKAIRKITDFEPEIAIVLGSGLGNFAKTVNKVATIDYKDIPDMPVSSAPSHKGRFVFGTIGNKKVVVMQGRVHLYEGYSAQEVANPIRIMKLLGCKKIILTNASGGINRDFHVGDFMMIDDHISCFVDSSLIGKNDDSLGIRFPDMSCAYDKDLKEIIIDVANKNNIALKRGIYTQLKGPQFETPAEIRMLDKLGSDAVGMSTVIETQAAIHCGLKVCGISLITNMACGILDKPLTSEEVSETANRVEPLFEKFITEIIKAI